MFPSDQALVRRRRGSGYLASSALGVYALVFVAWVVWGGGGERQRTVLSDLAFLPVAPTAAVYAWRASRAGALTPSSRRAWRLIALALLSWGLGDLVWCFLEVVLDESPFPSVADAFYLAYYPILLAGLVAIGSDLHARTGRIRILLDSLTVTVVAGLLVWLIAIDPALRHRSAAALATVLNVAYPVGDVLVVFGATVVLLRRPPASTAAALRIIVVGALVFVAADMAYARLDLSDSYVGGDLPDALWMVALWLFLVGAQLHASAAEDASTDDDRAERLWAINPIPYVAVLAGYGMLLFEVRHEPHQFVVLSICAFAIALIVSARQLLALRENTRLRGELERLALLEERDRIARDLHDGIVQALFAVGLSLQGVEEVVDDRDEVQARLNDAVQSIDLTIRQLRDYIFGLHPAGVAGEELGRALRDLGGIFRRSAPMSVNVTVDANAAAALERHSLHVIQAAREALSNAIRHSRASTVALNLGLDDSHALLEVQDDGCGFAIGERSGHGHGLANLQARADALRGTLHVESVPNGGTTVRIRVPV